MILLKHATELDITKQKSVLLFKEKSGIKEREKK